MSRTRLALWVIALGLVAWGVLLLIVPGFVWETLHGAEPVSPVYSRYGGAWFLGVTVAAWLALRGTLDARPVLVVSLVGAALSAVVLLVDTVAGDLPGPDEWIIWLAIVDAVAIAALSYVALQEPVTV